MNNTHPAQPTVPSSVPIDPSNAILNQQQEEGAELFFQFLFSNEKEFGISGGGGVGKSFLLSHLIDRIIPRYHEMCEMLGMKPKYEEVELTSTTNKAADVLQTYTKRPVGTIYSFMNLKVEDDFTTGQSRVKQTGAWKVHERIIIFVDECSLIDTPLDQYIQAGTNECKIVYVGDHCQLAPITETLSPIYEPGRMKWVNLTQPMRTQIPELLALNTQMRRTVETGVFEPIKIVPGIIDYLDDDQMQAHLMQTFGSQTDHSRVLGYTNRRVVLYNEWIREQRNLPSEFQVGEKLVNTTALRTKNRMLSVEEEVEIIALGKPVAVTINNEVDLWVRPCTLQTPIDIVEVNLPADRQHYAELIAYYRKRKNWPQYYKLRNNYVDLRQRDAATGYKAQGSSYDTAYADLTDISVCHNPNQAARLLYVVFSRVRHRLFLYGSLAQKYGGLLV